MAKFCTHCGSEVKDSSQFCKNCGASIKVTTKQEVVENKENSTSNNQTVKKDNTVTGFVCSIIGALCCTYVAIPGLILSIQSLKDMKEGKIADDRKWMAIIGIVLSCVGLLTMVYNLIHPNQQVVERINELFNQ